MIELASRVAEYGVFILPQQSVPFRYSGVPCYRTEESGKYRKFWQLTGIDMQPSCGIDTSRYVGEWKGVSPICEVVVCDFTELPALQAEMDAWNGERQEPLPPGALAETIQTLVECKQAGLFGDAPAPTAPTTRRQRRDRKEVVERQARMAL